ncbi:MAG: TonB-dependent receptor [Desulfobacteraceae bacterium]|nr:TonB-dependent receptor [Desulfobacteraceae bacterium]
MKKLLSCIVVLFVCTFLFLPASISAQEKGNVVTMEEVVVTATKTKEKRKDIPNAVIIMDEIDIQESPASSLGELLANELGIDWRTYGNYGGAAQQIYIRGMGGDATQVFVNGVSVNSPSLGTADVAKIPLNSIERIEVVKGSGSLLYGSGAMGGTVNIITKRPKRDKMDLKASAGYGSQDTYRLSVEQGMFLFGDFGYYLTANRRETDGFRDNSDLTHNDVSLKLVYDKGDVLDISLYGDYIDREYGRPGVEPPVGTQDVFINGEKAYNSDSASLLDKGRDEDVHAVLQVKSTPSEWISFNVKGHYTDMESISQTYYNYPWVGMYDAGESQKTWLINEVLGVEGNVEVKPYKGIKLLLGADYKDHKWDKTDVYIDTAGAERSASKTMQDEKLRSKGAFAEVQYRPCRFFKVLAGIRHEDHSTFGHEDLPRWGLIINPLERTALKLSHGKHFKSPTPNDLFWADDGMCIGNTGLKPETGWHTDATIEQNLFDDKVFVSLTYFEWNIENQITWAETNEKLTAWGTNYYTPSNVNKNNAKGCEIGTKIGPFYNLSLALDYTYTDAKEEKPNLEREPAYTPEHQFKGNLIYWSDFGMTATTTVRYVSDRGYYRSGTATSFSDILDSYWTMDLKIEQRMFDNWLFFLQGNNLFDKGYDTYMSYFTDENGLAQYGRFPGAGRSVFFSVAYEF